MLETLPGFREFYPEDCATRNAIFQCWRKTAHLFGFQEFDAPILEPLELFTQKSGEEIVEQLFAFEDKGGRKVALRPETTPSLARLVGARSATLKRPIKWFNITENFRYERPQKGRLRSFYQFNVDILGETSFRADAELIALAIESFRAFGLDGKSFFVRLSDRLLWKLWFNHWGITEEPLIERLLGLLDKWERRSKEELQQAFNACLADCKLNDVAAFFDKTNQFREANSLKAIEQLFSTTQRKVFAEVEKRLGEWKALLQELALLRYDEFIRIDLGIVRGLAYYTGFVFEVFEKGNQGRALAGGGRYDHLLKKLSNTDLPAVGFAAGDVTLCEILAKEGRLPKTKNPLDYFLVADEATRSQALCDATLLREQGISVEYSLGENVSISKQLKKAHQCFPKNILFYGEEELKNNQVQLKNLAMGTQALVNRNTLFEGLKS